MKSLRCLIRPVSGYDILWEDEAELGVAGVLEELWREMCGVIHDFSREVDIRTSKLFEISEVNVTSPVISHPYFSSCPYEST